MYFRLLTALAGLLMCASYAAAFPNAYITNLGDSTVSVFDTKANKFITKIQLGDGQQPYGVAVSEDGKRVYVSNKLGKTISVIDALTDASNPSVINTITLGNISPRGLAINPAGTRLYVTGYTDSSVSVLDVSALTPNTIVSAATIQKGSLTVGNNPEGIAINPAGTAAYVSNFGSSSVSKITIGSNDTYTVSAPIPLGNNSNPKGITATATAIYVANNGDQSVSVINASTNAVTTKITNVGDHPFGITATPDGSSVYVSNEVGDSVAAINTTTNAVTTTYSLTQNGSISPMPQGIAVTPDGMNLYINTYRGTDNQGSIATIRLSDGNISYISNQPDSANSDFVNFFNAPVSLGKFIGPPLYNITTTASDNGTVTSPEGKVATNGSTIGQIVKSGATAAYTITPNSWYRVNSITINGTPIALSTDPQYNKDTKKLTLTSIMDDKQINVVFIKDFDFVTVSRAPAAGALAAADGAVTSSVGINSSINCSASTSTSLCNAQFQEGTTVTLTATPNPGYYFAGWVGSRSEGVLLYNGQLCDGKKDVDAQGRGVCSFPMSTFTQFTATFTDQLPNDLVRMMPEGIYKHIIQDAFNAATSTTTDIQLALADFPEPTLNLNNSVANVTLSGGWDADKTFKTQGSTHSTITGTLTLKAGKVTINGITIK